MASKSILKIDHLCVVDPLTTTQKEVFSDWNRFPVLVLQGYAGTGKSFIALYKALETVLDTNNQYKRVLIIRSAVPSRDIGFLPGDLEEKISVYEQPYIEMCSGLFERNGAYQLLKEQKKLDFQVSSFLRGITFDDTIIIVDEFQNMTYQELSTIITRVGENTKIVFCGDTKQNDIYGKSGASRFIEVTKWMTCSRRYKFTIDDIVRSGVVKEFLIAEGLV